MRNPTLLTSNVGSKALRNSMYQAVATSYSLILYVKFNCP